MNSLFGFKVGDKVTFKSFEEISNRLPLTLQKHDREILARLSDYGDKIFTIEMIQEAEEKFDARTKHNIFDHEYYGNVFMITKINNNTVHFVTDITLIKHLYGGNY